MVSLFGMRISRRTIITLLGSAAATGIVVPIIQANVQEWAKAQGYDQFMVKYSEPTIASLIEIMQSPLFIVGAAVLMGGALWSWTDHVFRQWQLNRPQSVSGLWDSRGSRRLVAMIIMLIAVAVVVVMALYLALDRSKQAGEHPPASAISVVQKPNSKGAEGALMEAALAFASRNGKKGAETENAIQIRSNKDGKDPYISTWDYNVAGPWPSVGTDGFTAFQLHMLPAVYPMLKTQGAREELGSALKELSDVTQGVLLISDRANTLRAGLPPLNDLTALRDQWERAATEANDLLGEASRIMEYFDQEILPKKYPLYREEIAGTCPRQIAQPYFIRLRDALIAYEAYARLYVEIGRSDNGVRLGERANRLYGSIYNDLSAAAGSLRDWSIDSNRRIGMMLRAL